MSNRGKPLRATNDDNRCQALTVMTGWKREHNKEERCPFMAKWSVGKNQLCSHHARMEAVALAVEKGYMTRLIIPPCNSANGTASEVDDDEGRKMITADEFRKHYKDSIAPDGYGFIGLTSAEFKQIEAALRAQENAAEQIEGKPEPLAALEPIVTVDKEGVSFGKWCWVSHEKITGCEAHLIPTKHKQYYEWFLANLTAKQKGGDANEPGIPQITPADLNSAAPQAESNRDLRAEQTATATAAFPPGTWVKVLDALGRPNWQYRLTESIPTPVEP